MGDWILGNCLTAIDQPIDVWTLGGQVRRVIYRPHISGNPWFTDCTHPSQNVICDREYIQAWRVVAGKSSAPEQPSNQAAGLSAWERALMGIALNHNPLTSNHRT